MISVCKNIFTMKKKQICSYCIFYSCICLQALKDWQLALGVLTLVLVDLTILLVYTIMEGLRGNLTAKRVPNRENPRVIEGVGNVCDL